MSKEKTSEIVWVSFLCDKNKTIFMNYAHIKNDPFRDYNSGGIL